MVSILPIAACGGGDPGDAGPDVGTSSAIDAGAADGGSGASAGLDPTHFLPGALVPGTTITTEPCTLSGGAVTTCHRISLTGAPADHAVGPFCPRNISDGAEAAGIWIESGEVYDVSGAWVTELATFYGDPAWQLFDPATGEVNVTDTRESCTAAARPDVDPAYNNYCVECAIEYVAGGVEEVYLIPVTPVPLATPAELGRMQVVGVALNGVTFDPPAPTAAILAAHTIAAFDDCGGHVNLMAGYHYHAATGCSTEIAQDDGHAPLIGYALDGYGIFGMADASGVEPDDLDDCRGHTDAERGYHYHVASAGENMFIGCFHGQQGSVVR